MIPKYVAALAATALLLTAPAACGSDSPAASPTTTAALSSTATSTGDDEATPLSTEPAAEIAADNSCHVEVTGAHAGSWANAASAYTFTYGGFFEGSTLGPELFGLNCFGPGESSVLFAPKVGASIPPGPADYTIAVSNNVLGGTDSPEPMQVLVTFDGSHTNWGPSEPGILHLTQFDETGIAGTFELHVTDVLARAPYASAPSEGDAVLIGTFAYKLEPIG